MPFIANMNDEQKPEQSVSSGPVSPTGGGSGAVQLAPQAGGPTAGVGSGKAPAATGGSFASLDKYLSANQGQAEPLAGKLTAGIGQQYNTLAGQNTATLNDIGSQVAAGGIPGNANDVLAQEAANPVSFASNQSNIPSFQKLLGATYSGPTSAESTPGFTNQQNAINTAINTGQQATKTEAGRENLLVQNEATPTTGVTALNSAILSQSPTALGSVEKAYDPFSNLLTGLNAGAQDINKNIAKTQGNVASTSAAANKQIADQVNALNANVNSEFAGLQGKYSAANDAAAKLASGLQSGTLPTGLGVDPGLQAFLAGNVAPWMAANAPGVTPTYNFANAVPQFKTNPAPTLPQAATAEDYAKVGAFQNLLAGLSTGAPVPIISPTTAAQAGTYNLAALPAVNNQALAGDIAAGLNSGTANVNVAHQPYEQFLGLLQALNLYQGNNQNAFGPEAYNPNMQYAPGPGQTYSSIVPTIA